MNLRHCTAVYLAALCVLVPALGQMPSAFANTGLYEAVLARVFRYEPFRGVPEVRLRFTYCDTGEMQVVARRLGDSGYQLEIWRLPKSSPNVWNQLAGLVRSDPRLTAEGAAATIKVIHQTVTVPASSVLGRLIDQATFVPLALPNQETVTLDGMSYGVAVRSVSKDVDVTVQGPQRADESKSELIRWMGRVRSAVEQDLAHQ